MSQMRKENVRRRRAIREHVHAVIMAEKERARAEKGLAICDLRAEKYTATLLKARATLRDLRAAEGRLELPEAPAEGKS